jgi:hypothetical protein
MCCWARTTLPTKRSIHLISNEFYAWEKSNIVGHSNRLDRGDGYGLLRWAHLVRDIQDENRIASPEMLPESWMLPHLICSRPMFIGGANDEADQHVGA